MPRDAFQHFDINTVVRPSTALVGLALFLFWGVTLLRASPRNSRNSLSSCRRRSLYRFDLCAPVSLTSNRSGLAISLFPKGGVTKPDVMWRHFKVNPVNPRLALDRPVGPSLHMPRRAQPRKAVGTRR
jgi:hypothetical protein